MIEIAGTFRLTRLQQMRLPLLEANLMQCPVLSFLKVPTTDRDWGSTALAKHNAADLVPTPRQEKLNTAMATGRQ